MGYFQRLFSQKPKVSSKSVKIVKQPFREVRPSDVRDTWANAKRNTAKPSMGELEREAFGASPFVYLVANRIATYCADIELEYLNSKGNQVNPTTNAALRELDLLLEQPNFNDRKKDFIYRACLSYLVTGNTFISGGPKEAERYGELIIPLPSNVTIENTFADEVQGYHINYYNRAFRADRNDVLHIKDGNFTEDDHFGHSANQSLRAIWRGTKVIVENEQLIHERGVRTIVSEEGDPLMKQPNEIKEREAEMNRKFSNNVQGGKIAYSARKLNVQRIGELPKELMSDKSLVQHLKTTCAAYNAPFVLFDPDRATYSNMETAYKYFYTDAVLPVLNKVLDGLNHWLVIGNYGLRNVKLSYDRSNIESLNAIDHEFSNKVMAEVDKGILTVNEARQMLYPNLPPLQNTQENED